MRPSAERSAWSDLQPRIESSGVGRIAISAFVIVTLVAIVAINLPGSNLRVDLLRPGQPYLNALGLDQDWALFAPDPRRQAIGLRAVVRYDDGTSATWTIPQDDPVIGTYRDYRWRKWMENVDMDANQSLWRPAALWAAREEARPDRREFDVTLVRLAANLLAPGTTPIRGPWQAQAFFNLRLTGPGQ
ncbi:MAG TPA: hypothetical protein VIJ51_09175 [Solirubrobacteraceae bacterium]